ncbi:MAG: ABC transporter substrate-binding protein, partial [Candidatus Rokubacteria bacterium]|nr:ABC transporter substrate-binding protein [Candidatus Rokubacteria bacterium]
MMMRMKAIAVGIALLLVGGAFTSADADNPKVRLGIGYALAYVPLYVAQEKGFFKEEGVDVEFVPIEVAPDMMQSIIGGSTDAGVAGSFGVISFVAKGAPVSTVATYGYGGDRIALAVRKGAGVKSLTDLYGKKVAVQTGTIA